MKIKKYLIKLKTRHDLIGGGFCYQNPKFPVAATSLDNLKHFFETVIKPCYNMVENKIESHCIEQIADDFNAHYWTKAAQIAAQQWNEIDARISLR